MVHEVQDQNLQDELNGWEESEIFIRGSEQKQILLTSLLKTT